MFSTPGGGVFPYFLLPSSATGVTALRPTKLQLPQPREFQPWSCTHYSQRPTLHMTIPSSPCPQPPGNRCSSRAILQPSLLCGVLPLPTAQTCSLRGLHTRRSGKSCSAATEPHSDLPALRAHPRQCHSEAFHAQRKCDVSASSAPDREACVTPADAADGT